MLPSLGETGVVTTTVAELFPGVLPTGVEDDVVAEIKGRAVMAQVIARAVRQRQRVPAQPTEVRIDGTTIVVTPSDVSAAIARARRGNPAAGIVDHHRIAIGNAERRDIARKLRAIGIHMRQR